MKDTILPAGDYLKTDEAFQKLYPRNIQAISKRHWTPLHIVRYAATFLGATPGAKVLDVGSGIGKFCLAAAHYMPSAHFFGIEQRGYLVKHARSAQAKLSINNVSFIEGNFTQADFNNYDHFYFFNSFFENLFDEDRIDDSVAYSESLYDYYSRYLYNFLRERRSGTRVVTYHTLWNEVPREYKLVESLDGGELNFWVRR